MPSPLGLLERIELELPGNPQHELLIYRVLDDSPLIEDILLPRWARPALVVRGARAMKPEQIGQLKAGDHVYLFAPAEYVGLLDRLFSREEIPDRNDAEFFGQFTVNPDGRLIDLLNTYDLQIAEGVTPDQKISDFMVSELGLHPVVGDRVSVVPIDLVVRRVHQGRTITKIGLALLQSSRSSDYAPKRGRRKSLLAKLVSMIGGEAK